MSNESWAKNQIFSSLFFSFEILKKSSPEMIIDH